MSAQIKMLHDRVLVEVDTDAGERRSTGGIVIPATASVGRRLSWGEVVATGPNVRQVEVGDSVLFDAEERAEVEIGGKDYLLLRERDLHAVAAPVRGSRGELAAVLGVQGPASRFGEEAMARALAPLLARAAAVSDALGWRPTAKEGS